jgi:hypothetical protein
MRVLIPLTSVLAVTFCAALTSCGPQGPEPPKPGSPAYIWAAAQEAFQKGNFIVASNQLDKLAGKESEFKARAEVLDLVVATGIARGDMEWADILEDGGKYARTHQLDFRRAMNAMRTESDQMTLRAAEISHKDLTKLKDADLVLAFALPKFPSDVPIEAERVKTSIALTEAEQDSAHMKMIQRGVVKTYAEFAGSPKDIAKARALVGEGNFKLTKDAFLVALAHQYAELTAVYGSKKLDKSGQVKLLCGEAETALGFATPGPAVKDVQKQIDAAKKKLAKN